MGKTYSAHNEKVLCIKIPFVVKLQSKIPIGDTHGGKYTALRWILEEQDMESTDYVVMTQDMQVFINCVISLRCHERNIS